MITYDKREPLVVIHIPKAAGTSTREIFRSWFHHSSFFYHYYDEVKGEPAKLVDLEELRQKRKGLAWRLLRRSRMPVCIHGHFNQLRGFGVENRYPTVKQFVTILRDPFETAVSTFHYTKERAGEWKDPNMMPKGNISDYLAKHRSQIVTHFPRKVTRDNYKEIVDEYFIEIGLTECLPESMFRIAKKLGKRFDSATLPRINVSKKREEAPSELKEVHRENNELDYEVFDFIQRRFRNRDASIT